MIPSLVMKEATLAMGLASCAGQAAQEQSQRLTLLKLRSRWCAALVDQSQAAAPPSKLTGGAADTRSRACPVGLLPTARVG